MGLGGAWGLPWRRKSQSLVGWEAYLSGLEEGPGTLFIGSVGMGGAEMTIVSAQRGEVSSTGPSGLLPAQRVRKTQQGESRQGLHLELTKRHPPWAAQVEGAE